MSDLEVSSLSGDERLEELVRRIRIGDQTASTDYRAILQAGTEFLLRRKLGRMEVAAEAATIIEATIHAIQTARSSEPLCPLRLILNTIDSRFPLSAHLVQSGSPSSPTSRIATSIVAEMSPSERSILRDYYALGHTPDMIQTDLGVSLQTIRQTLTKARSLFFQRAQSGGKS